VGEALPGAHRTAMDCFARYLWGPLYVRAAVWAPSQARWVLRPSFCPVCFHIASDFYCPRFPTCVPCPDIQQSNSGVADHRDVFARNVEFNLTNADPSHSQQRLGARSSEEVGYGMLGWTLRPTAVARSDVSPPVSDCISGDMRWVCAQTLCWAPPYTTSIARC
jgi:hypothetical protein